MSDAPPPKPDVPKSKPSKIIIAFLVLNLGASGFAVFKLLTAATPHAQAAPLAPVPETSEVGPVHSLDPFVVNLDEPGTSRYLKVTIQLELVNASVAKTIAKSQQLVRDAILSHLSGLKLADTLGVAAKDKLRSEIIAKLDAIIGAGKIKRLFFQEFVVQ